MHVADGKGGMVELRDQRFFSGDWPVRTKISADQADCWFRALSAEIQSMGWSSGSLAQLDRNENSGSYTLRDSNSEKQISIAWSWKRNRSLQVKVRSIGPHELSTNNLQEFIDATARRCDAGPQQSYYRVGQLTYDGLPWRGELWLKPHLRLGPPALQDETALLGPRVIFVETMTNAFDAMDATYVFNQQLRELSVFLSVVLGKAIQIPATGRAWTLKIESDGSAVSEIRNLGYWEPWTRTSLPVPGLVQGVPAFAVTRPDFTKRGLEPTSTEQVVPDDVLDLLGRYSRLAPSLRQQFLKAASKFQEALVHWAERGTLSFALMVVACEALKPADRQFDKHNIYDVVESLLGSATSTRLKQDDIRAQIVRSEHLHVGEFKGLEFDTRALASPLRDPTFDEARRVLFSVSRATIIQWILSGGSARLVPNRRPAKQNRTQPMRTIAKVRRRKHGRHR